MNICCKVEAVYCVITLHIALCLSVFPVTIPV